MFLSGSGHVNGPVTKTAAAMVLFALITIILTTLFMIYTVYYEKEYFSEAWEEKLGVSLHKQKEQKEFDAPKGRNSRFTDADEEADTQKAL